MDGQRGHLNRQPMSRTTAGLGHDVAGNEVASVRQQAGAPAAAGCTTHLHRLVAGRTEIGCAPTTAARAAVTEVRTD